MAELQFEYAGCDLVDWTALRKRGLDLLRRSKDPVRCLARMREKTMGFLGIDSGDLGNVRMLKKGDRASDREVMMPASIPVQQNLEKFETEKEKEKSDSQEGDRDHVVSAVDSTFDCDDFNFYMGAVGTNSEKTVSSSSLEEEFGFMLSSDPAFLRPLDCWRNTYYVQQDEMHQLGWKKGIIVDRILEITVVKLELQDEKLGLQESDLHNAVCEEQLLGDSNCELAENQDNEQRNNDADGLQIARKGTSPGKTNKSTNDEGQSDTDLATSAASLVEDRRA